jgi:hypothetical protein
MQIRVDLPASWTAFTVEEEGRSLLTVEGGLRIEIDRLVPLPADRAAWAQAALARDLPAGTKLELVGQADGATTGKIPMTLVTAKIRGADGNVVEVHHVAFYVFGDRGGVITCRLLSREATVRFTGPELESVLTTPSSAASSTSSISRR